MTTDQVYTSNYKFLTNVKEISLTSVLSHEVLHLQKHLKLIPTLTVFGTQIAKLVRMHNLFVVFNYIIDPTEFEKIKVKFKQYDINFKVLLVDKETILKRDKQRPVDCQMNERALILLDEFINHN